MRTLPIILLLAGLTAAVPAHAADGQTCLDKPATIVDLDGGTVLGTEGDDVIVAGPDVTISAGAGRDAVCVTGTDDADYVDVRDGEDLGLALGGGYDTLHLYSIGGGVGTIDSGADGAYLELVADRSLFLDLGDDTLSLEGASPYTLTGAWDVTALARIVRMLGDSKPNHLRALNRSCHISIEGGRGKDWLAVAPNTIDAPTQRCRRTQSPELLGQGGDDLLIGYTRRDRLIGGPGRDTAKGGFGRDTCRAEVEKSCER
jgi:Ca2+-binding RTX toxin-like protein